MRTKIIGTARAAVLTAGFVALGVGTAFPAGAYGDTSGAQSALGGNQADMPVNSPVNACGNSLALFGTADGSCKGGASAQGGGAAGGGRTSGRNSLGGGNQIDAPVTAPVNACGNAVAVFGSAGTDCKGGAKAKPGGSGGGGGMDHRTTGRNSVLGGSQVHAPSNTPVNVCGNSAAAFGDAVAACKGGAKVAGGGAGGGTARTSGRSSVLGGSQVHAPANAPVNVCGNAIGNATAACKGGSTAGSGASSGSGAGRTSGKGSVGGGNQAHMPHKMPVDVCGNAAGAFGEAAAACQGDGHGGHGGGGGGYDDGGDGYAAYASRAPLGGAGSAVAPNLPTVPGITGVRPMDPAGALPIVPELPVQSPVGSSSSRTATTTTTAAAPASRLPEPVNGLKGGVQHGLKNTPVGTAPKQLPIAQDAPHTMRPAAAGTPLSSGMTDDSLYVLALGALLAGASTVIAVTRRVRFGRH